MMAMTQLGLVMAKEKMNFQSIGRTTIEALHTRSEHSEKRLNGAQSYPKCSSLSCPVAVVRINGVILCCGIKTSTSTVDVESGKEEKLMLT
jgi:hypothetical protein